MHTFAPFHSVTVVRSIYNFPTLGKVWGEGEAAAPRYMYVISCWLHSEIHYLGFIQNIEGSPWKREGEKQKDRDPPQGYLWLLDLVSMGIQHRNWSPNRGGSWKWRCMGGLCGNYIRKWWGKYLKTSSQMTFHHRTKSCTKCSRHKNGILVSEAFWVLSSLNNGRQSIACILQSFIRKTGHIKRKLQITESCSHATAYKTFVRKPQGMKNFGAQV